MAGSVHGHAHLSGLFDAGEVQRLLSASADVRAMMLVEGALAKVQGQSGIIPELSAAAIQRTALAAQIDPEGLADATAQNGVVVPALVAAFREAMQAPEHAQYVHWGATSQDIIDTALMLRLRQATSLIVQDVKSCLNTLAALAQTHATAPMAARTYGQHAAPTSFGAVVATWGWPLVAAYEQMCTLEFPVSLSGAAGTASELGENPVALRTALATELKLTDPQRSWHTDRTPVLAIADAFLATTRALQKLGEDLVSMTQSDVAELALGGAGASSTMPQKQNPVAPSVLVAVAQTCQGLNSALQTSATHRFQRDGAAWFTEWMVLPQLVLGAAASAKTAATLIPTLTPNRHRMAAQLNGDKLLFAEALSFALAKHMPRPDAQAAVKTMAQKVRDTGQSLQDVARQDWPELAETLFDPVQALGSAPQEARRFHAAVQGL